MKIGQTVNLYHPSTGERVDATVVKIEGAGDSFNKVLTLKADEEEYGGVSHQVDAEEGNPFWMVKGKESAPKGWADKKKAKKK